MFCEKNMLFRQLLRLLMRGVFSAPLAVFFELKPLFDFFLVLSGKIIIALAGSTFEFY